MAPFDTKNDHFHQDRLGTDIGKTQKKMHFPQDDEPQPFLCRTTRRYGRQRSGGYTKTLSFPTFVLQNDPFTKTGSGQLQGKLKTQPCFSGCYWGLPSISADDVAFQKTGDDGYWRGHVWGPMIQLTYWGLQNYDHVPAVVSTTPRSSTSTSTGAATSASASASTSTSASASATTSLVLASKHA